MDKEPRIHPQMEKVPVRELDAEYPTFIPPQSYANRPVRKEGF